MQRIARAFAIVALPCLAARAGAQSGVVSGSVTDAATGAPLVQAEVRVVGTSLGARTDSAGRFHLDAVPRGPRALAVRRIGFRTSTAEVDVDADSMVVAFALVAVPTELAAVRVDATKVPFRLQEFEERRRRRNGGYYIASDELLQNADRALADLVRGAVPAVTVQRAPDGSQFLANRRDRTRMRTAYQLDRGERGRQTPIQVVKNAPCVPRIFLDGLAYTDSTVSAFSTGDLAGVEFHDVSTMPVQYRRTGTECGVLLLWSR